MLTYTRIYTYMYTQPTHMKKYVYTYTHMLSLPHTHTRTHSLSHTSSVLVAGYRYIQIYTRRIFRTIFLPVALAMRKLQIYCNTQIPSQLFMLQTHCNTLKLNAKHCNTGSCQQHQRRGNCRDTRCTAATA